MIVKLHGTSGSGKSTVARALMEGMEKWSILHPANRKVEAYKVHRPDFVKPLYVLGPYNAVCGGLDSLSDVGDHIRLLETYGPLGHVFYEGLLGSEYYGRIGKVSEMFGDQHIFAFLDTPIEVCIERIKARRLAKGNLKPLNESNTRGRVAKIERLAYKLRNGDGIPRRQVVQISYLDAAGQILDIYREAV